MKKSNLPELTFYGGLSSGNRHHCQEKKKSIPIQANLKINRHLPPTGKAHWPQKKKAIPKPLLSTYCSKK